MTSWIDIKYLMRTRFVPFYSGREGLLITRRHVVNEYFKLLVFNDEGWIA